MINKTNVNQLVKGNSITFTTSFYNANNALVVPSGANLKVSYFVNFVATANTIVMSTADNGNTWTGVWDSSPADQGLVDWNIKSTGAQIVSEDGQVRVIGNAANP
jgi:hypothetical protein